MIHIGRPSGKGHISSRRCATPEDGVAPSPNLAVGNITNPYPHPYHIRQLRMSRLRFSAFVIVVTILAGTSLYRTAETSQLGAVPSDSAAFPQQTVSLWQNQSFWRVPLQGGPRYSTDSILISVSQDAYWFIEREAVDVFGFNYTQSQMSTIGGRFESEILPTIHQALGSEPSPPGDADGDPNITILITSDLSVFDPRNENPPSSDPFSNAHEMIYVRFRNNTTDFLASVAHELAHLVQWNYDPFESGWVNEGMAMVAEHAAGFSETFSGAYFANTTIGLFSGRSHGSSDYGGWELLFEYLTDRFGGWDFARAVTQSPLQGVAGIEDALRTLGHREAFREIFKDWTVANLLNRETTEGRRFQYANVSGRAAVSYSVTGVSWSTDLTLENGGVAYIRINSPSPSFQVTLTNATQDSWIAMFAFDMGPSVQLAEASEYSSTSLVLLGTQQELATATLIIAYVNLTGQPERSIGVVVSPRSALPVGIVVAGIFGSAAVAATIALIPWRRRRASGKELDVRDRGSQ